MFEETNANYTITTNAGTFKGVASVRGDFFDGDFGTQANNDVLDGIIAEKQLPITTDAITDWELTPAG